MSAFLIVLGWLLLGLVVLLAVVLLTPVEFRFEARTVPKRRIWIGAALLAGRIPAFPIFDSTRPRKPKIKKEKAKKRKRRKGGRAGSSRVFPAGVRLVADLLREIHIVRLRADAEFGLADPAETGQLYGRLTPILFGIPGRPITLRPRFDGAAFAGRAEAVVRLTPGRLLPPAVRFAWRAFGPAR